MGLGRLGGGVWEGECGKGRGVWGWRGVYGDGDGEFCIGRGCVERRNLKKGSSPSAVNSPLLDKGLFLIVPVLPVLS